METLDEVLEHYGILGMRWGVRRTPEQLGRARRERRKKGKPVTPTKAARKEAKMSPDARRAQESIKKAKKGGAKALSNQELQDLNNRMNLEQQYSRLTQKPGALDRLTNGKKKVDQILGLGKTIKDVHELTNSSMGKQLRNNLGKKKKKEKS